MRMELHMSSFGKAMRLTIGTFQGQPYREASRRPQLPWYSGLLVSMATPHQKLLAN